MTKPTIKINRIARQVVNTPFTVSGTISNPSLAPKANLEFSGQPIAIEPFVAGGLSVAFSFQHSGFSTRGMHTVTVTDKLSGVSVRSNLFLVYG